MGRDILEEISRNLTWVLKKSCLGSQEILLGFSKNLTLVFKKSDLGFQEILLVGFLMKSYLGSQV